MLDLETLGLLAFISFLTLFLFFKRKSLTKQGWFPLIYFLMYKTKWGLTFMDKLAARHRKLVRAAGYLGIFVGFAGMAFILFVLVKEFTGLLFEPKAAVGFMPVLPLKGKGILYVPFSFWIVSIFIIALVHEFAHGIVGRAHNFKIKSTGFAFLSIIVPVLPAAFVEPDEEEMKKFPIKSKLSMLSAGPLANIILAFLVLPILIFGLNPVVDKAWAPDGIEITSFPEGVSPARDAGISAGETIFEIDGVSVSNSTLFLQVLAGKKPGDSITLKTDVGEYTFSLAEHPENSTRAYLGIIPGIAMKISDSWDYGKFTAYAIRWIARLMLFLYILNLGIGLFNLVPAGPLDGGKMVIALIDEYAKNKRIAMKIFSGFSMVFLIFLLYGISRSVFG